MEQVNKKIKKNIRIGIRVKAAVLIFGLGIIILLCLMVPGTNYFLNNSITSSETNMKSVAKWIANAYVSDIIYGKDNSSSSFESYLTFAFSLDSDMAAIIIMDNKDKIVNARVSRKWFEYPESLGNNSAAENILKMDQPEFMKKVIVDISDKDNRMGKILLYFSLKKIYNKIKRIRKTAGAAGIFFIILLSITAYYLSGKVTKPVIRIAKEMEKVSSGNFNSHIDEVNTGDELEFLASTFNKMTEGLREREKIKRTFSRYVSKQVFEKITKDKYQITLGGENRRVTILFSDIRGFTTISERLRPEEIVHMLNRYFDRMLDIIFKYEGTLDKFMGDAIMAVFNAPIEMEYPELRAVYSGLGMLEELNKLNDEFRDEGLPQLDIGVGINTGEVVAGNIGSKEKIEYTVIGDPVNLAQRLESATKEVRSRLLISDTTYEQVKEYVEVKELEPIYVKGREKPVKIYSVISASMPES